MVQVTKTYDGNVENGPASRQNRSIAIRPGVRRKRGTPQLYRHHKNGITTLENKTRSDKDATRKVQVSQLAEAIHEVLPTLAHNKVGVIPKSVLYRVLLQRSLFTRSQLAPTTFYRMLRTHQLLDDKAVQKQRMSFAMQFANQLWQADTLYGPAIRQADGAWRKTFLIAFIDHASRVITVSEHDHFSVEASGTLPVRTAQSIRTRVRPR
ncbi:MAG: hypothetical protein V4631_20285 [Pseudomonadota bacterium]